MKIAIGISIVVFILVLSAPSIFSAMKKRDYQTMYHGMQDAKRKGGAYVADKNKKKKRSYEDYYAYQRRMPK